MLTGRASWSDCTMSRSGLSRLLRRAAQWTSNLLRSKVWQSFEADIREAPVRGRAAPARRPTARGAWGVGSSVRRICSRRTQSELPISVVVCTKDRPDALRRVLRTLQQVEYGAFEVLVVDNAPSSDATRECVEEFAATDPRYPLSRRGARGSLASAQCRPRKCPVRLGGLHRRRRARRSVVVARCGARDKAGCRGRVRDRARATRVARRACTAILR